MNKGLKIGIGAGALVVALLTVLFSPGPLRADSNGYLFTSFDFPNIDSNLVAGTQAYGINARGDIVGTYWNTSANNNRGFLLRAGQFTQLDFPDGDIPTAYTIGTAIGPAGDIAGYYGLVGGAKTSAKGFVLDKHGHWTTVENTVVPEPTMTPSPFRILPDGTMVGCFHYANAAGAYTSMHGFTLAPDGTLTRFDYPPAPANSMAMHYGATPDGRTIVGQYTAGLSHGYLVVDGVVHTFDVPGSDRTTPMDINAGGVVVGTYRNAGSAIVHSFAVDTHLSTDQAGWDYTLLVDVPGASITRARGINAGGDIVGDYVGSDGKTHGFVARKGR